MKRLDTIQSITLYIRDMSSISLHFRLMNFGMKKTVCWLSVLYHKICINPIYRHTSLTFIFINIQIGKHQIIMRNKQKRQHYPWFFVPWGIFFDSVWGVFLLGLPCFNWYSGGEEAKRGFIDRIRIVIPSLDPAAIIRCEGIYHFGISLIKLLT